MKFIWDQSWRVRSLGFTLFLSIAIFFADQVLKTWCSLHVATSDLVGIFNQNFILLSNLPNQGFVANYFSDQAEKIWFSRYVPSAVWVGLLLVTVFRFPRARLLERVCFGLMLAGGGSNLWNQWKSDAVIDTLQVSLGKNWYLPFNIADVSIILGTAGLFFLLMRSFFRKELFGQLLCNDPVKLFVFRKKSGSTF